jgi:lipopolysaccharide transport system ATP-binding protein
MSKTIIQVENVGKLYKLGEVGTGTISHDLHRWWAKLRRKEDPFAKIGEVNDRTSKGSTDYIWALKDVNFEVKEGEVLGIIGRNGAGKSTLLKILSKVTKPTLGEIRIKGRIASLLEVGTGFHPELTGRENIFLNSAILGMTKTETKRKFDEIVDFSGVERYIDTPVKRYSSGMYVRLAFAVAAFLEPEILIVDEVLAVGDAEFQKKCLGKMKDVSINEGRTVLFVSHNMTAMNTLCNRGIYMNNGTVASAGGIDDVIKTYLSNDAELATQKSWQHQPLGDDAVQLLTARLIDENGNDSKAIDFYYGGGIEFTYQILKAGFLPVPNMQVYNQKGELVMTVSDAEDNISGDVGVYRSVMKIPPHLLNDGRYIAGIAASTMMPERIHFYDKEALVFDVVEDMNLRNTGYRGIIPGVVRPKFTWKNERLTRL